MKPILTACDKTTRADRISRHQVMMFLFRKRAFPLLLLFSIALPIGIVAQTIITGSVKDETGSVLPAASVRVKDDTTIGTLTNESGNYTLNLPAGKSILTVTSIGYQSQDVAVNKRATIDIVLAADKIRLDEVIIIGYTKQQKKDITGSVAVVDMPCRRCRDRPPG